MTSPPVPESAPLIERLNKHAEIVLGGSIFQSMRDDCHAAAARISQLEAELARLRDIRVSNIDYLSARVEKAEAELATARRDALEQAAKVCDARFDTYKGYSGESWRMFAMEAWNCAAAIRAMVPK